jgi:hypothetical protein
VYQLDFGGRVTQESAKNFQIEYKGKQVPKRLQAGAARFFSVQHTKKGENICNK